MGAPVAAGRSRPRDLPGRELAAGLATAAVAGQLLFAQATLAVAVALIVIGRTSRWRPGWLLLPGLAGLGWRLAVGGGLQVVAALPRRLAVTAALAHQLPSALLLGSAEAAVVLWLVWYPLAWRPGLAAALRRRTSARALSTGHTVAPAGFALGLVTGTGKPATVTWAEAERGVVITGPDEGRHGELVLTAACAAMRLRKAVLMADLSGVAAPATVGLARSLGVPVTSEPDSSAAAQLGRALRRREVAVASRGADHVITILIGILESLRAHDLRADCLVCISGSERLEPACLDRLLQLGPVTGTALLISSASEACVAGLSRRAQIVVAEGAITGNLATQLASDMTTEGRRRGRVAHSSGAPVSQRRPNSVPVVAANLAAQQAREFTVLARRSPASARTSRPYVLPHCLLVPVDVTS